MRLSTSSLLAFLITNAVLLSAAAATAVLHLERMAPLSSSVVSVEQHRARDRARHARLFNGMVNFSVYGSADPFYYGIYFTKVKLGTPPREFNLQIDTGSDLTWLNSKSCPSCPRSSRFGIELNPYDVAASSTSKVVPCLDKICAAVTPRSTTRLCSRNDLYCGYKIRYLDGGVTSGVYASDIFHFESVPSSGSTTPNASAGILFGVSSYTFGRLTETWLAVDGIFGFGKGDLSVLSQLHYRGITPRVFSHCLKGGVSGGGVFVLGEISAPGMVYTPLVTSQPNYGLHLESITVNGKPLPVDSQAFTPSTTRGTFLDMGTTLSFLVLEAYDLLISTVSDLVSKFGTHKLTNGWHCYDISSRLFPRMSFNFAGGASLVLKPEDYLILSDDGSTWCIGFQKLQGQTILGDLVMKDKIFVYNLVRQRVGWVSYDCSSSMNISVSNDDFFNPKQSRSSSSSRDLLLQLHPMVIILVLLFI